MRITALMKHHPRRTAMGAVLLLALGAFGLYWFAPWNLFIDRRVDEALPEVEELAGGGTEAVSVTDGEAAPGEGTAASEGGQGAGGNDRIATIARGRFRALEHETVGTALIVELEDGSRYLRLEDLETSNGPDLRVLLTDQPVSEDWGVWDDGTYADLGALKGNLGSSNYQIPADLDLGDFETAVIWCRRFSVGFGVAALEAAA
jgi:hypothetical protein